MPHTSEPPPPGRGCCGAPAPANAPDSALALDDGVDALPGVGEKRAAWLAQLGVATVRELLYRFPRAYEDRRAVTPIAQLEEGRTATIEAEIVRARPMRLRRGLTATEALLRDATGEIRAIWFGLGFLARALPTGARGFFTGTVGAWRGPALRHPDYELLTGDDDDILNTGRIVPVYPLAEKLTQRSMRTWTRAALDAAAHALPEPLPESLRLKHALPDARQAIRDAHFPEDPDAARHARDRFAYEELLGIQLGILQARAARLHLETGIRHRIDGPLLRALRDSLPFELTPAQRRAVDDLLADMASPRPMLRLLQGDVGCGKTVVALHAVAAAADGGYQVALMAPTEILAEQHALALNDMLAPLGVSALALTGSSARAAHVRKMAASGRVAVLAGTHALIQESTVFDNLGLVIIDEQHRFGVLQRDRLAAKGANPDILHMTATPIPRTLAITVYGGMDISVIDELPPGRTPTKTSRVPAAKLPGLYEYLIEQARLGLQAYIVCPLVDESPDSERVAVTALAAQLAEGPLAGLRLGLIHGRMSFQEKDTVMHRFKRGEIDVLCATTVIEVGIDCPNAATIVIMDAGGFGLTQLHQLRGRVGRGPHPARCFLLGAPKTTDGKRRLEVMCSTASGFDIAEADLALRGPGEFNGVRQSGLSDLRVADLIRDARLLDRARRDAQEILDEDPALARPEHALLAEAARRFREFSA